jgi:peptide/nickel transport system permease protein
LKGSAPNPSLPAGLAIVVLLVTVAGLGPLLAHADPLAIHLSDSLARPSGRHLLGCDALGRDVFARIVYGARLSLGISVSVVALSLIVGSLVGGLAGLSGGWIDELIMRAVDILLAFPGILLAITLAAILGPGVLSLLIALSAMGWTTYARLVRGEVLSLREREYVQAAETLGARPARVLVRHLIPAMAGPVVVQATFGVGGIVAAEAALSFLGLGALPPTPSWGDMLDAGRAFMLVAPYLTIAPGLAIGLAILGFNLLGDGLAQLAGTRS